MKMFYERREIRGGKIYYDLKKVFGLDLLKCIFGLIYQQNFFYFLLDFNNSLYKNPIDYKYLYH
jgi:hypothetical protein